MQSNTSRNERVKALHDRLIASVEELVSGEDWEAMLEISARFTTTVGGGITFRTC